MTLLEKLQTHRGGLLRLKTEIFWYGNRGWDRNPGRICLILDAASAPAASAAEAATTASARGRLRGAGRALLLIEGSPQWIWVAEADVELIDETR